jgi:hypothetical protein
VSDEEMMQVEHRADHTLLQTLWHYMSSQLSPTFPQSGINIQSSTHHLPNSW